MRNKIILLIIIMIISIIPIQVYANNDITVTLNGQKLNFDVSPKMINNRVMVPMRAIFEPFGMEVNYTNGKIFASDNNNRIQMNIGLKWIYKNTENIEMDVAPVIVNNRTLVPVRAIAECLDANVQWNGTNRTVIITTDKQITVDNTSVEDYKYYVGVDFRSIKRQYSNAKGQFAFVTSYVNKDNETCILTDIWYTIISNYHDVTLHNITTGQTIKDPKSYYNRMAKNYYGTTSLHYMELNSEVTSHLTNIEQQKEGIKIDSNLLNELGL